MELEFKQETISDYEILADMTLCQEETMESIVPDACPDILRISDVCGQAMVTGKQAHEGLASVSGVVKAVILYQPEGGSGLRKMDVSLPFHCQGECAGLNEQGTVHSFARLRFAEARALNPRKVLLRVDLVVDITAFCHRQQHINCSIAEHCVEGICQQNETQEHCCVVSVQEKPFTFYEQIWLQGNQNTTPIILAARTSAQCTENKLIGSKLIFKGTAELFLLLMEQDGTVTSERHTLPFSQIAEVHNPAEDWTSHIRVEVTEFRCRVAEGDPHSLETEMELLASVLTYARYNVALLSDLYSTTHMMETESGNQTLLRLKESGVFSQGVRELMETATLVRSVVDSRLTLGKVKYRSEGQDQLLTTDVCLTVLYLDENDTLQCAKRALDVTCRVTGAANHICRCVCSAPGEVFATPAAGGIEIRFNVDFLCRSEEELHCETVTAAKVGQPRCNERENRPSVVLRLAMPGEGLWELAKAYGTTTQLIMQANGLESEGLPGCRMLLIPSCR